MENLTPWEAAIKLPVISAKANDWNSEKLEYTLKFAIGACVNYCQKKNNGKICTTLSGGLDSSFCLAIIRSLVSPNVEIHTFTTGGSINHPDIQAARLVSKLFSTSHHELIPTEQDITVASKKVFTTWQDEPDRVANVGVFLTYRYIAAHNFKAVIAHDGIDELLGGYWEHRRPIEESEKIKAFENFWDKLEKEHLLLLTRKAQYLGIEVIFPYLQQAVIKYIAQIPVNERTTRQASKLPLRKIAGKYLPEEIIFRKKMGFCNVLDTD